jgi:hypothetical protein
MGITKPTTDGHKLVGQLQLARLQLTRAASRLEDVKEQARIAKRRRKEAKLAARLAKKRVKTAKAELADARAAMADAETRLAQAEKDGSRKRPKGRNGAQARVAQRKSRRTSKPARTAETVLADPLGLTERHCGAPNERASEYRAAFSD